MFAKVVWHGRDESLGGHGSRSLVRKVEDTPYEEIVAEIMSEVNQGGETIAKSIQFLLYANLEVWSVSHIQDALVRLADYAVNGVISDKARLDDTLFAQHFMIHNRVDAEMYTGGCVPVYSEIIFNKAYARFKIDRALGNKLDWFEIEPWAEFPDQDVLTIEELALLSQMHEQSIRNEIYKGNACLEMEKVGSYGSKPAATVTSAIAWLRTKPRFRFTLPPSQPKNSVMVPVAKDGSRFQADCRMTGGFKIGKKGSEEYFDDIEEALSKLQKMSPPRWRRPNDKGNFGIVTGVDWVSVDRTHWLPEGRKG